MRIFQPVVANALRFDHRTLWFACGRTLLALATMSELLFTDTAALFPPVGGVAGPLCQAHPRVSLFCLGTPDEFVEPRRWLAIVALLIVASGYRPRLFGLVHLWITFSVATSITLPDGGDSIALIGVLIITPMCLVDDRRWHWSAPISRMTPNRRVVAHISSWGLRLQLAYLYANSAIAKMGVDDWQNGSAFYYFVRDKMFGASGVAAPVWMWLSSQSVPTLIITWGTVVVELLIAVFILLSVRWRLVALWMSLALHASIFASMGLFSFSLVMTAIAIVNANPNSLAINPVPIPLKRKFAKREAKRLIFHRRLNLALTSTRKRRSYE